ncbi:hypothetical protein BJ138DRAFT_1182787 [Hygrophoropsis aurantiaca]|uniref:Uncharacterized protein n=1 Tax=Hygrophoropsis aurantiaca TaxID=72124 RepID=A0ACB8A168_9AGAM|nr:hypothetical protein BJ138DRAFT_1182787 [Hygrophoropsis aurantiaca]
MLVLEGIFNRASGPPPSYQSRMGSSISDSGTERTSLLGYSSRRNATPLQLLLAATFGCWVAFTGYRMIFPITWCDNPMDPGVRDRIRQSWEVELHHHDVLVANHEALQLQWKEEDVNRDRIREAWEVELHRHEILVVNRDALRLQWKEEDVNRTRVREGWEREAKENDRLQEERRQREEGERLRVRERWEREVKDHDRLEGERRQREENERSRVRERWEREVKDHDRLERERRQKEEDERLRMGMFWADLVGDERCTAYATREYSAHLINLPDRYPYRVEACMGTPAVIHGVTYKNPSRCFDDGYNVYGYWSVDHNEPGCSTFWEYYKDKGCIADGSGKRRIEQFLANVPEEADWQEFCASTPTTIHSREYKSPNHCFRAVSPLYVPKFQLNFQIDG